MNHRTKLSGFHGLATNPVMLLGLLLSGPIVVLGGVPITYNQVSRPPPNPVRCPIMWGPNFQLGFMDPNSYTNPTFMLISAPTNGLLEYRSDLCNGRWLPVPVGTPISNNTVKYPKWNQSSTFNNCKWSYTCTNGAMSGIGKTDSFTWRMANNEGPSTNLTGGILATCYLTVTTNRAPVAEDIYRNCAPGTDTTFPVAFSDGDAAFGNSSNPCGQVWSKVIVTPPTNGAFINNNGLFLTYRPNPGTTHRLDHFTYRINDTITNSITATGTIQIRDATDRAGNLVILVVDNSLLSGSITNAIYRLKNDLENEGYTSKIKGWTSSNPSNLWAYLVSEYTNTSQFLVGAILIGAQTSVLPPLASVTNGSITEYTDLVYWNLKYFQTQQKVGAPRNIWVSRISAPNSTYGGATTLLQRALDANHDYRTGASRLPHKAFCYTSTSKCYGEAEPDAVTRFKEVWPNADYRGAAVYGGTADPKFHFLTNRTDLATYLGADCLTAGGEMFEETSDGGIDGFLQFDTYVSVADVHRAINQIRFVILDSCACGSPWGGGLANNMIVTRGGGCVLAIGATATFGGGFLMSECNFADIHFRKLINAGESIGTAAVEHYAFTDGVDDRTMFYGDLSLPVMAVPANSLPVIRSCSASVSASHSPAQVSCSVNTYDPDGAISKIEWFMTGYDGGRAAPTSSGVATNFVWSCPTPGIYTSRVEVMDNYKARAWQEFVINVTAPTACVVTASSGAGGSISPSGAVVVALGSSRSFTITPAQQYHVNAVMVDGTNVGVPTVYTFSNITVDHTITALFSSGVGGTNAFRFTAVALTNNVMLRWLGPQTCGIANNTVRIRYGTSGYPSGASDNPNLIYEGTNTIFEHTGLTPNQPYYYTIWVTQDGVNYTNPP
jgi:hypothetical protein